MEQMATALNSAAAIMDGVDIVIRVLGFIFLVVVGFGVFTGLAQATWRFGLALSWKKVYVFGAPDDFATIQSDLVDSGLIRKKNIESIAHGRQADIDKALLIVYACKKENGRFLDEVLKRKKSRCGLIVYCPSGPKALAQEQITKINDAPFTTVCNFRGRLVNDVLLMMLSTSFTKSDVRQKP